MCACIRMYNCTRVRCIKYDTVVLSVSHLCNLSRWLSTDLLHHISKHTHDFSLEWHCFLFPVPSLFFCPFHFSCPSRKIYLGCVGEHFSCQAAILVNLPSRRVTMSFQLVSWWVSRCTVPL